MSDAAGFDPNNDGRADSVTIDLDLTRDRAHHVLTRALAEYAEHHRARARLLADLDMGDAASEVFELADVADDVGWQLDAQIDRLSRPRTE